MATYAELYDLAGSSPLLNRIAVACVIQANVIRTEAPPSNSALRQKWAREVLADPPGKARQMLWAALAANAASTVAQINSASDAALLTAVAAAVDLVAE